MTKLSPAFLAISSAVEKDLRQRLRQIELAVAALDLRQRGERGFDGELHGLGVAAGALDQRGGHAFLVVEQHLQQVLGGELLVIARKRGGLRGLDEAAHALGVFFDIHHCLHSARPALRRRIG